MSLCDNCHGNEVVYRFWKNDKDKTLISEWLYCRVCFPDSSGYWPMLGDNWIEITSTEYDRLHYLPYPDNYHSISD